MIAGKRKYRKSRKCRKGGAFLQKLLLPGTLTVAQKSLHLTRKHKKHTRKTRKSRGRRYSRK